MQTDSKTSGIGRSAAKQEILPDSIENKDAELAKANIESSYAAGEVDGRKRYFSLRDKWSSWIIVWISTFIVFHIAITFLLGFQLIEFKDWRVLPLIVIENFLQICGMGYVVVKFLYAK